MKLYLFGGAEIEQERQESTLKQMINDVISEIKPKQFLHVPFARSIIPQGEEDVWGEGWVKKDLVLSGARLLDARNEADLNRAKDYIVFMNGGKQRNLLREIVQDNRQLYDLVMNAPIIIGESAGSMVCAEYMRIYQGGQAMTVKGLGILPSTIIEAHYTARNRHEQLRNEMKEADAKFGIGIDSATAIVIDTKTYPKEYERIGNGLVDFVT